MSIEVFGSVEEYDCDINDVDVEGHGLLVYSVHFYNKETLHLYLVEAKLIL